MDIVNLIISLVSGAIGGNVGGAAVSEKNLGTVANSLIGLIGGGGGAALLSALGLTAAGAAGAAPTGSEMDISTILANIGISGVSGGVLTAVIALIKSAIQKK